MSARMDRTISAAVEHPEAIDARQVVSVVVEPSPTSTVEELAKFLRAFGEEAGRRRRNTVQLKVKAGDLSKIADSPTVGSIRAARLHTAQIA